MWDFVMSVNSYNGRFVITAKSLETNVAVVTQADSTYHQHTYFVYVILWTSWRANTQCDIKKFSHEWYHIDTKENMW
jgi:hypothetical protein